MQTFRDLTRRGGQSGAASSYWGTRNRQPPRLPTALDAVVVHGPAWHGMNTAPLWCDFSNPSLNPVRCIVVRRRSASRWCAGTTTPGWPAKRWKTMPCASRRRAFASGRRGGWRRPRLGGAAAFLILEAVGATLLVQYGFVNALWAILATGADHLSGGFAHQHLRRQIRRRHGLAHARRGFWLHRLDADLADLCLVHLHLFRARSRGHGLCAGAGARHSAALGLSDLCAGGDSAGDARGVHHQPAAGLDAAAVAGDVAAAVCLCVVARTYGVCGCGALYW